MSNIVCLDNIDIYKSSLCAEDTLIKIRIMSNSPVRHIRAKYKNKEEQEEEIRKKKGKSNCRKIKKEKDGDKEG